ncbi:subtilisin-like protein [Mycena metata]|uniref:tripeptidyl-peptidase II n=1 Tax=Mycena metata TaxID=1033252 RepID=A0AAD7JBJ4_9AGAR|nr:subtilisin-like protein [Mycena metata]
MRSAFLIFTPLLALVRASPTHVLHEARALVPKGYDDGSLVDADTIVHFRIALAQSNISGLKDALDEVSNPSSPRYGQYLSKEQIVEHTQASPSTISAIQDWLTSHNLVSSVVSPFNDWIAFSASIKQANSLLAADFVNHTHSETGRSFIRTRSYSIPAALKSHIEYITPTVSLPSLPPRIASTPAVYQGPVARATCTSITSPQCLQGLYGLPTTSQSGVSNALGIGNLNSNTWLDTDISTFMHDYRPDNTATSYTTVSIDGGANNQTVNASAEGTMDMEYTVGLVNNIQVVNYFVGRPTHFGDPYTDLFYHIGNATLRPTVLTVSYDDGENSYSSAEKQRVCNAAMVLGNMGISVLFASGDQGSGGLNETASSCGTTKFQVAFPASCPYVTAVGATTQTSGTSPETGASLSGGGFSSFFCSSNTLVGSYLANQNPIYAPWQNSTGRALPDVSARHQGWIVENARTDLDAVGTSMSSPVFASVIALLNNELIAAGKPALGFLNPWLYSTASAAFKDITAGNSDNGCGTGGYAAVSGWDPVTGLGTPLYASLRKAAGLA